MKNKLVFFSNRRPAFFMCRHTFFCGLQKAVNQAFSNLGKLSISFVLMIYSSLRVSEGSVLAAA